MFEKVVLFVKDHKSEFIKGGAAIAGAILGGVVAALLVNQEDMMDDEDDSNMLDLEEGPDEDEINEE